MLAIPFTLATTTERFASIGAIYFRDSRACVLCFSLSDPKSWNNIPEWHNEVLVQLGYDYADDAVVTSRAPPVAFVITGTKADLVAYNKDGGGAASLEMLRLIQTAQEWCAKRGYPFFLSRYGTNLHRFEEELFLVAVEIVTVFTCILSSKEAKNVDELFTAVAMQALKCLHPEYYYNTDTLSLSADNISESTSGGCAC